MSEFPSKEILLEHFRQSTDSHCLLGQRAESPQEFFCIELQNSSGRKFLVGICSHGIGIKPSWRYTSNRLFVGFNDTVAIIALDTLSLEQELPLHSLFWEFINAAQMPLVCVLCETAIVALCADGFLAWRRDTRLITGSRVVGSVLRLDVDDGHAISLDLRTGLDVH